MVRKRRSCFRRRYGAVALALAMIIGQSVAFASTYVVYVPVDDPIYTELDTLDGLGMLQSYLSESKPISRIEAARLALEARDNVERDPAPKPLAMAAVRTLASQLVLEIGWLERNEEERLPTMVRPVQRLEVR